MYREKYARQTAIGMYQGGRPVAEVAQMLRAEGATPEQAEELAPAYYQQYVTLLTLTNKKKLKQAGMYQTVGVVFLFGSLILSMLSYLLIDDGGSYVKYYGLTIIGVGCLLKSRFDTLSANLVLNDPAGAASKATR